MLIGRITKPAPPPIGAVSDRGRRRCRRGGVGGSGEEPKAMARSHHRIPRDCDQASRVPARGGGGRRGISFRECRSTFRWGPLGPDRCSRPGVFLDFFFSDQIERTGNEKIKKSSAPITNSRYQDYYKPARNASITGARQGQRGICADFHVGCNDRADRFPERAAAVPEHQGS